MRTFSFKPSLKKFVLAFSVFSVTLASAAPISLVSREEGSGTRGAFVEIFDLLQKQGDKKIDMTSPRAEITNSTAVMLTTIARNKNAIGYVSLGALNNSVKALNINGVAPSVENIKNKKYTISRPFLVITAKSNPLADDFLGFIGSDKVQEVITKSGYIPLDAKAYTPKNPEGKIVIAGSSSVTPLMEKLKELYIAQNPKATIEVQQSDSTTGVNATVQGIAHIGMVSRELKDSELAKGVKPRVLALDGLAVIVNPKNSLDNLSKDQVKAIFSGSVKDWDLK
ncbi:substrate-binding domain-containing protein [Helicobacter canis]|uniref:Phosphate ABC transporter substrate-binding protein n=1 Tax=Helicobacter canis TaxID=29419 RepID=A0A5M9QUI9_9HELI|nr:substrate-binding domain-containing protein [Helicobacter canis]KAA8711442.1 phosphate ABC transporter substrate-binding protein [Helicobacter canis]